MSRTSAAQSPEDAFLADIRAHPEDDAPRLIYADWLQEQEDPASQERAKFIRLQIERSKLGDSYEETDRLDQIRQEEGALFPGQWDYWRSRLGLPAYTSLHLRRGFVDGIRLKVSSWVRHRRRLLASAPIRSLTLLGETKQLKSALGSELLLDLRHLDLGYLELGYQGARVVADCPHLKNLITLRLPRNNLSSEGVLALANSPHLSGLLELDLSGNPVGDEGVRALASSPFLGSLQRLHLGSAEVADEGALALATSTTLTNLQELVLYVNNITAGGARPLAKLLERGTLQRLYLEQNRLSAQTRKRLAKTWGERISCEPGKTGGG